ncbi:sensor histidine kinase [Aquimarina sp. 2201CG5-10]|uniref:sensor histidine kinase n=1 Tax=Aquimarina callyspongiae TaxID=3098150 RepID=UPI002AB5D613|nr:sensor histidine kinase [Aquimarina sp. 2201CG5-10]MDY8137621.1 sensor histidine kinase [Aquimarina sp. 2201CG5-10]
MKSRIIHIYCFISFCFSTISAQHIKTQDISTQKKKLEYQLNTFLNQSDYEKALEIADSMKLYGTQNNDNLFIAHSYDIKSTIYMFKQDIINSKINLKKGIQIFEKYNHYSNLIELNAALAYMLREEGKLDSCLYILNKTQKKYVSDTVTKQSLQYFYSAKEVSHFISGRIDSSLYYIFKRIEVIEKDNSYRLGTAYLTLAKNFYKVDDLSKALTYINKSLDHLHTEQSKPDIATCKAYIIKGNILLKLKQYKDVEAIVKKASKLLKNRKMPDYTLQIKTLLLKLYQKTNQIDKRPKLIGLDLEDNKITSNSLFNFHLTNLEYSLSEKKLSETLDLIKKLEELIKKVSDLNLKQSFYQLSSIYWAEIKSFKKSYEAQSQYLRIKEKINTRQQTYRAYDLDQKYQLAKKNEEIAQQNFKIQEQENRLLKREKHQTYLTASIISSILGFVSLFFIYKQYQRIKKNEILALEHKQEIIKLESLIQGEEKERKRLAQDLHDGINGDLSTIKFKMTSINTELLSKKEKNIQLDAIEMLDNAVDQVRQISHNLAPTSLQNFDLVQVLQQLCTKISSSSGININFQYYGDPLILDQEKENNIYRIVQELINNIVKHAKATEALIQINNYQNKLLITIEDNGIGFDKNSTIDGMGLQSIKSRVNFLNAGLDIYSDSEGTSFTIEVDLIKNKKK